MPSSAHSAISMDTEPVPAPTSQQTAVFVTPSFASVTARTSCFVMGTSARRKALSGIPQGTPQHAAAGFSASSTASDGNTVSFSSSAVPETMRSSG